MTIYMLYEVFTCKDAPFESLIDTATHLEGQIDQKPHFGGINRHFPAKCAKYSNLCIIKTTETIPTKFCTGTLCRWFQNMPQDGS